MADYGNYDAGKNPFIAQQSVRSHGREEEDPVEVEMQDLAEGMRKSAEEMHEAQPKGLEEKNVGLEKRRGSLTRSASRVFGNMISRQHSSRQRVGGEGSSAPDLRMSRSLSLKNLFSTPLAERRSSQLQQPETPIRSPIEKDSKQLQRIQLQISRKEQEITEKENGIIQKNNTIASYEEVKSRNAGKDQYIKQIDQEIGKLQDEITAAEEREIPQLRQEISELKLKSLNQRIKMAEKVPSHKFDVDLRLLENKKIEIQGQIKKAQTKLLYAGSDEEGQKLVEELQSLRGKLDDVERSIQEINNVLHTREQLKSSKLQKEKFVEGQFQKLRRKFVKNPQKLGLNEDLDAALDMTVRQPEKMELPKVTEDQLKQLEQDYKGDPKNEAVRRELAMAYIAKSRCPERDGAVSDLDESLLAEMAKILTENPSLGEIRKIDQGAGSSYFLGVGKGANFKPLFVIKPFDEQPGGANTRGKPTIEEEELIEERNRYYGGVRGELVRDYVRLNGPFSETMAAIADLQHPGFYYRDGIAIPKECLIVRFEENEGSLENYAFKIDKSLMEEEELAAIRKNRETYGLTDEDSDETLFSKASTDAEASLQKIIVGDVFKRGNDTNMGNILIKKARPGSDEGQIQDFCLIDNGTSSADTNIDSNGLDNNRMGRPFWSHYSVAKNGDATWLPETVKLVNGIKIDEVLQRDQERFAKHGVLYTKNAQRLDKEAFRLVRAAITSNEVTVPVASLSEYTRRSHFERNDTSAISDAELPGYIMKNVSQ